MLERPEAWFTAMAPGLARAWVDLVSGAARFLDAHLLRDPAGGRSLAIARIIWGDAKDARAILEEAPGDPVEDLALTVAARIEARRPAPAWFRQRWVAA